MAKNQTIRLSSKVMNKDLADFAALKKIATYKPANPAFEVAAIEADRAEMDAAMEAIAQAIALVKTKRDEYVAAQWKFHNSMDGGRTSTEAQFGKDSNEVQSVGRKKASEYKSRSTKPKGGNG